MVNKWTCVRTGDDELKHHGIKGQKWGVRRFQNKDGSLTPAGKKRYDEDGERETKINKKELAKTAAVATAGVATGAMVYKNRDSLIKGAKALGKKMSESDSNNENTDNKKEKDRYKEVTKQLDAADKSLDKFRKNSDDAELKAYEKRVRAEVHGMDDKELQQIINRLNMEERYAQVMVQRHRLERGENATNKILSVAGDAIAGATTAVALMAAIMELKKNSKK